MASVSGGGDSKESTYLSHTVNKITKSRLNYHFLPSFLRSVYPFSHLYFSVQTFSTCLSALLRLHLLQLISIHWAVSLEFQ